MKFTLSTKPFSTGLDLAVLKSISNFDKIGSMAQLTVSGKLLKVNMQTNGILSQLEFHGAPEDLDMECTVLVSNSVLRQLVATLDTNTLSIDFVEGGIKLISGNSDFSVPMMSDASQIQLKVPAVDKYKSPEIELNTAAWRYIKANQASLISAAYEWPVYTMICLNDNGDVLAGDMTDSMFSHSSKSDLGQTCLISPVIAELFSVIPESATARRNGDDYLIQVDGEGYKYIAEIFPKHEVDPDMGEYNAEIILGQMQHPEGCVRISPADVNKSLNQAALLSSVSDDTLTLKFQGTGIKITNKNINCDLPFDGTLGADMLDLECEVSSKNFKKVMKPFAGEMVNIGLVMEDDGVTVNGIILYDDDITIVLGGVE